MYLLQPRDIRSHVRSSELNAVATVNAFYLRKDILSRINFKLRDFYYTVSVRDFYYTVYVKSCNTKKAHIKNQTHTTNFTRFDGIKYFTSNTHKTSFLILCYDFPVKIFRRKGRRV